MAVLLLVGAELSVVHVIPLVSLSPLRGLYASFLLALQLISTFSISSTRSRVKPATPRGHDAVPALLLVQNQLVIGTPGRSILAELSVPLARPVSGTRSLRGGTSDTGRSLFVLLYRAAPFCCFS